MSDFYKKITFLTILIAVLASFIIKFFFYTLKSEVEFILNSPQGQKYIEKIFKSSIQKLADKKVRQEELIFYKKNFEKIYIKYKSIFEDTKF